MITRVSSVIRPKGSDLIFDHPYNAESARLWDSPTLDKAARRSTRSVDLRSPGRTLPGMTGHFPLRAARTWRCRVTKWNADLRVRPSPRHP